MIYTIGTSKLKPARLEEILAYFGARLIDVRTRPLSRVAGWSIKPLTAQFGEDYTHIPALGGYDVDPVAQADAMAKLESLPEHDHVMLLCMEHPPGECHRHHSIAMNLKRDVLHVYQDQIIHAKELHRSILAGDDDDYAYETLGV